MTKGIKRELGLEEEVMELDRQLMSAVRRNLAVAEKLHQCGTDENARMLLERYLSRHILLPKRDPAMPEATKSPQSEPEKRVRRMERYFAMLSDQDIQNVMDLVKSMYRARKVQNHGMSGEGIEELEKEGEEAEKT